AVIVEDDPLVQEAPRNHRGHGAEEKRPVRGRKHMHDVHGGQTPEAWQIAQLVRTGSDVPETAHPEQSSWNSRVDGEKRDGVAVAAERVDELACLNALASQDVEAGRDERDARSGHER